MTLGTTTYGGASAGSTSTTSTLTGTITQDGTGVSGARVWAVCGDTLEFVGATTTDSNGDYLLTELPNNVQILVGVQFDDGTQKFGRAKSIQYST
jgi:hypothetical protein